MSTQRDVDKLRAEIAALRPTPEREVPRLSVPSVVEFVLSDQYLGQPIVYPGQATLLRVIFLELEHLTAYDLAVLAEWAAGFERPGFPSVFGNRERWIYLGYEGIVPDVLERMAVLRSLGRRWFRYVVGVIGRRGGKGHLGALCAAYIIWQLLAEGDTRAFLGLPPRKQIHVPVFAGSRAQSTDNLYRDIANVLVSAPCFAPYLVSVGVDRLELASPADVAEGEAGLSTIVVRAASASPLDGRGAATPAQFWDEVAHVTPANSGVSAADLFAAASPAADQFRGLDFFYFGSTPAQKAGPLWDFYVNGLEFDPGTDRATRPDVLVIQQTSWGLYQDWDLAHEIPTTKEETP